MDSFERWCNAAAGYIKYKPDRAGVYKELYAHLEDKRDALIASGLSEEDAERLSLRAMGDAAEVGRELKKAHKPFWGYLLFAVRVLFAVSIVLLFASFLNIHYDDLAFEHTAPVWSGVAAGDTVYYSDCEAKSDGYTFSVPSVVVCDRQDSAGSTHKEVHITFRFYNPRPWVTWVTSAFYAVDSFGNYYYPAYGNTSGKSIDCYTCSKVGFFTYQYTMWLNGYEGGAEWIELRYTEHGRDICLHIDLTEGITYENEGQRVS